jgi:hypothetical protein
MRFLLMAQKSGPKLNDDWLYVCKFIIHAQPWFSFQPEKRGRERKKAAPVSPSSFCPRVESTLPIET